MVSDEQHFAERRARREINKAECRTVECGDVRMTEFDECGLGGAASAILSRGVMRFVMRRYST
ncbi:UNVERIFIED_CONTAM: hypothetical protein Sradi_2301400 [Sesamum radiatum]|uniref:Uncharacterized protein n=1 Tax=Sesamum radiatum TaxID=300843 RepID=A0AAW2T794_SESRA